MDNLKQIKTHTTSDENFNIDATIKNIYDKIDRLQYQVTSLQQRKDLRDYNKMTAADRKEEDLNYLAASLLTEPKTKKPLFILSPPIDNKDGSYTLRLATLAEEDIKNDVAGSIQSELRKSFMMNQAES